MSDNPFDVVFDQGDDPFAAVFAQRPKLRPPKTPPPVRAAVPGGGGDPLVSTLQQAGFKGDALRTAWAIAKRESGGRAEAFNPKRETGDLSYGLFQINMLDKLGPDRRARYGLKSNEELLDPATNARVAYAMSKQGTDFGPWGIGPNAYRKMPSLNFSGFPGAQTLPNRGQTPQAQTLPWRGQAPAYRTLSYHAPGAPDPLLLGLDPDDPFASVFAEQSFPSPPADAGPTAPVKVPKGEVDVNRWTGHGTHITDGLDLNAGRKTAVDIMAAPGTAVPAPADGVVLRLGSAQGGDSMYFKDTRGFVFWLGHVDSRYSLPQGTRVRAGQTLTRVSADHPAPHLHLDRTLAPTNRFG